MAAPAENDMGSIKKLQTKINEQEKHLARYKKRLQDLVVAHKKLIADKEGLEENLKTITSSFVSSENVNICSKNNNKEVEDRNSTIVKLSQSLTSLIDEKKQLEADFQIERKKLVQRNAQLEDKLRNLSSSIVSMKKLHEAEVEKVKTQLNLENNLRELNFSSNIKELQNIITEERKKREEKENVIVNLQKQLEDLIETSDKSKESDQGLRNQLDSVRTHLETENAPQLMLEKLKKELQIMKEQHNHAVNQEQMRAIKAEDKARRLAMEHENRVSKLELKLSQFSDLASNFDKHRQEDQKIIMKLKNRLIQLELENINNKSEDDQLSPNDETLIQQLQHIKHQLLLTCKTDKQISDLKDVLLDGFVEIYMEDSNYEQYYFQLKKQFEEYVQQIPRNQSTGDTKHSRDKINSLKSKIINLESTNVVLQQEMEIQREQTEELLEKERDLFKIKLNTVESEYRNKCITLERELEKQRLRFVSVVEEKEKELLNLQRYFPSYKLDNDSPSADDTKLSGSTVRRQSSTLIYYLEDSARKEADIANLWKSNNDLQIKLHNTEKELLLQMQLYVQLQQEIDRLEKQQDNAEELNTQYLKNVFHNYFITSNSKMKSHMLNAIFSILKFSDLEINQVLKLKQQDYI